MQLHTSDDLAIILIKYNPCVVSFSICASLWYNLLKQKHSNELSNSVSIVQFYTYCLTNEKFCTSKGNGPKHKLINELIFCITTRAVFNTGPGHQCVAGIFSVELMNVHFTVKLFVCVAKSPGIFTLIFNCGIF